MSQPILHIKIISPKQDIYSGEAYSVSSFNSQGKFDLLPQHANFITLIQNSPIFIRTTEGKQLAFHFPLAILYSEGSKVNIYTDIHLDTNLPNPKVQ